MWFILFLEKIRLFSIIIMASLFFIFIIISLLSGTSKYHTSGFPSWGMDFIVYPMIILFLANFILALILNPFRKEIENKLNADENIDNKLSSASNQHSIKKVDTLKKDVYLEWLLSKHDEEKANKMYQQHLKAFTKK